MCQSNWSMLASRRVLMKQPHVRVCHNLNVLFVQEVTKGRFHFSVIREITHGREIAVLVELEIAGFKRQHWGVGTGFEIHARHSAKCFASG
jgi:hypothetical protein